MTGTMDHRRSWKATFELIRKMRREVSAPVDTIGCASLYDRDESPKMLVSLLLSSQTKDEVTAAAVERLKSYPGGLNAKNMCTDKVADLENIIKPVGFYRRKAKSLIEVSKICREKYDCDIPKTAEDLMALPGIGPKMAYLALQHAWNENAGIGVDVHVHRISNRLGWVKTKEPEQTRTELESFIPKEYWKDVNHMLVGFGQTICSSKTPKCFECLLKDSCPSSQFRTSTKRKRPSSEDN